MRDWHHDRLHAPPHGYYWVQIGNEFALVSARTGIVSEVVFVQ